MSFESVKPFTESEIQPNYSTVWLDAIEKLCDGIIKTNGIVNDVNACESLINKSVIRSMLVMDLLDCAFTENKELAHKIFKAYSIIIDQCYSLDKYSFKKNIHRVTDKSFMSNTYSSGIQNRHIAHWCFNLAYIKWQDIYADNTYEITGPFQDRNYTYIHQQFHLLDVGEVEIITRYDKLNIYNIEIDMFGHLVYQLHEPGNLGQECILLNGEQTNIEELEKSLSSEYEKLKQESDYETMRYKNLLSRFRRYIGLFKIYDVEIDIDKIELHKLFPRLSVEELKEKLTKLI